MEYLGNLELNRAEIKEHLSSIVVNVNNISYEMILNMPVTDRDIIVKSYNTKIKKENS